jgi:hypothetical protein
MNEKLVAFVLPISLAVFGVVRANAAQCFVSERSFPDCTNKLFDTAQGSCENFNVVQGIAAYLGDSCEPATKFIEAYKIVGTQSAFVSGVSSSGATISNCTVVVSSPIDGASQHHKTSIGGCGAAVKWQIRMFD